MSRRDRQAELAVGVVAARVGSRRRIVSALELDGLRATTSAPSPADLAGANGPAAVDAVVIASPEPDADLVACVRQVRDLIPRAAIVVLAASASQRTLRHVLSEGVDALVLESDVDSSLALAVRSACTGQLSFPRTARGNLGRPVLSAREKQVLGMVVLGFTNGEIAQKLHLAESTVKSHLSSSFGKLGVRSRNEAATVILDSEGGLGMGILAISDESQP